MDEDEFRFHWQELENLNFTDLAGWYINDDLVGIVDEKAGGIIAYCHRGQAANIMEALQRSAGV